jgi:hypothetical protein
MTVQELIHLLEQIEDKTKEVRDGEYGDSIEGIFESDTCVYI